MKNFEIPKFKIIIFLEDVREIFIIELIKFKNNNINTNNLLNSSIDENNKILSDFEIDFNTKIIFSTKIIFKFIRNEISEIGNNLKNTIDSFNFEINNNEIVKNFSLKFKFICLHDSEFFENKKDDFYKIEDLFSDKKFYYEINSFMKILDNHLCIKKKFITEYFIDFNELKKEILKIKKLIFYISDKMFNMEYIENYLSKNNYLLNFLFEFPEENEKIDLFIKDFFIANKINFIFMIGTSLSSNINDIMIQNKIQIFDWLTWKNLEVKYNLFF